MRFIDQFEKTGGLYVKDAPVAISDAMRIINDKPLEKILNEANIKPEEFVNAVKRQFPSTPRGSRVEADQVANFINKLNPKAGVDAQDMKYYLSRDDKGERAKAIFKDELHRLKKIHEEPVLEESGNYLDDLVNLSNARKNKLPYATDAEIKRLKTVANRINNATGSINASSMDEVINKLQNGLPYNKIN